MERDFIADVKRSLARSSDDFDRLFPGETERFARALARAYSRLLSVPQRFGEEPIVSRRQGPRDQYSVSWYLLFDACNGLLGAFTLLQRGYETETLAASRVVLERVALALVIVDNPSLVSPFMQGRDAKLSTRAIEPAGRVLPQLAKTWGALSEVGSHVGPGNIGTSVGTKPDEALQMVIGGRLTADTAQGFREGASFLTDVAEQLLSEAPERIFFDDRRKQAVMRSSK